ncbi:transcriptional regulator, MarR family [Sanguibacter keddieii DSM 10542]|uniref:Transcriptional regulator, MarR family n=1 Tax=Sanguibacter keddieii (strain ATCC 51767 / DSM 10542 / NCFB 3025 / ST-74) TaxID=446469 RepID=D1BKU7_SANKS|nr:MarR family transcriptional regulator [Sanguibacter keddieii]ACZ22574.1 transcriptional regulator, MarR family [Sanguibacter keddieii DSM 10542]
MDFTERVVAQWAERRPDLDVSPVLVLGRVQRIAAALTAASDTTLAPEGLTRGEFDLLTALRRAGRPLRPSEITTVTSASGAAITKRLDRLTRDGLVERTGSDRDRRVVLVTLTPAGEELVDRLFAPHVAQEAAVLDGLTPAEVAELERLLAHLLHVVDPQTY